MLVLNVLFKLVQFLSAFVGKKRLHTIVTCLECGEIKRFHINSQNLWSMQREAWKIVPNGIVDDSVQLEMTASCNAVGHDNQSCVQHSDS